MEDELRQSGHSLGYYAVAFIDLLGQRDELRQLGQLPDPDDRAEMQRFAISYDRTIGRVRLFHETFIKLFSAFQSSVPSELIRTVLEKTLGRQIAPIQFGYKRFWDGIQIYVPLSDENSELSTSGVWGLLGACAGVFLIELAVGQPMRGGIDVGIGEEIEENEIYGNAQLRAYELESKTAQYPRIVIGAELMKFLHAQQKREVSSAYSAVQQGIAKACCQFITYDLDGEPVLDYLGDCVREFVQQNEDGDKFPIEQAYKNVLQSLECWEQEGNAKLASRYGLMKRYFDSRIDAWRMNNE